MTHQSHLPPPATLRAEYASGLTLTQLADRYGLAWHQVRDVIHPAMTPARQRRTRTMAPRKRTPEIINLADPANYPAGFVSRGVLQ